MLQPKQTLAYDIRRDFNAFICMIEGTARLGDTTVSKSEAALLTEGDPTELSAPEPVRLVVIGEKLHGEKNVLR